jgi:type II secretory pathway component PulF
MKDTLLKSNFSSKIRAKTWKKLARHLQNNVPELEALEMLKIRAADKTDPVASFIFGGPPLAVIFTRIIDAIDNGATLDEALYPWVPHEEIMLIRAGKKSAKEPEALLHCVELIEAKQKIIASVVKAVAGPLLMVALFIVLLLLISHYLVPALSDMSNPLLWDGAAGALYSVSSFVASAAGVITLVVIVGLIATSLISLPFWTGPLRVKFDSFPPWSIYRLLVGSIWLFTVATLLRAKIPLDDILKDMLESGVLRPWLQERVLRIDKLYHADANFGTLLLNLKMNFPDEEMAGDLSVYASLPTFQSDMYEQAKGWFSDGIEKITTQALIINVILFLCMVAAMCGAGVGVGEITKQLHNMGAV